MFLSPVALELALSLVSLDGWEQAVIGGSEVEALDE